MEKQAKNKKSNRLTKRVLSTSTRCQVIIIVLILIGTFAAGYLVRNIHDRNSPVNYYVTNMGNGYEVRIYYDGPNRITKIGKHRAVVKDVDWVKGNKSDSLWVVAKGERRAFFNTMSGKLISPFIYRKAWCYSEGVAAVLDDSNMLKFIDPQGNLVINKTFSYNQQRDLYYQFHNQMCPMLDTMGKVGLIDMSGSWVVEPIYDSAAFICGLGHSGSWSLMRNDSLMVIDSMGQVLIDWVPGQQLRFCNDWTIEVWHNLYPGKIYDTLGNILANQSYWQIERITYYEDGYETSTNALAYYTEPGQCGLMSIDGKILTDARYNEIEAIDRTIFRAEYSPEDYEYSRHEEAYTPIYVLLNDKGELVEDKNDINHKK